MSDKQLVLLKAMTAAQVSALPDLPPEEMREAEYRRGYADGWAAAIEVMWALMFREGLSRAEAYDAAWDYWELTLFEWRRGDCSQMILPPACDPSPRRRRGSRGDVT